MRKFLALAAFLLLVFAVSAIGGLVTFPKIPTWYAGLIKPPFNPPPWVFGPVWTVLYVLMAVAAWRVWSAPANAARRSALTWFYVQLALNCAWSPVFFGLEQPRFALGVIVVLLVSIGITIQRFFALDRLAGWMLVPYIAWVTFATVLNGAIAVLN